MAARETAKMSDMIRDMFPEREYTDKQNEFFDYAYDIIRTDKDTSKITILPARCGIGKSTLAQGILRKKIEDFKNGDNTGLIYLTSSVKQLYHARDAYTDEERAQIEDTWEFRKFLRENEKYITLVEKDNKDETLEDQWKTPILMMTTQRWEQSDVNTLKKYLRFSYFKTSGRRTTIIFDEEPTQYNKLIIGVKELDRLHAALNDGIQPGKGEEPIDQETKRRVMRLYEQGIYKYLYDRIVNFEYQRENRNTYLYDYDENRTTLTDNDAEFLKVFYDKDHLKSIKTHYQDAEKVMLALQNIVKQGALFESRKTNGDYKNHYVLIEDMSDHVFLADDIKTFVFDATASCQYGYYGKFDTKATMAKCTQFNVPLDYMTVKIVNINTSKNAIIYNQQKKQVNLSVIMDYLKSQNLQPSDSLLISYMKLVRMDKDFQKNLKELGFSKSDTGYFGSLRGFNSFRNKHNVVQIGLNCHDYFDYLLDLFYYFPEMYSVAIEQSAHGTQHVINYFDKLLNKHSEMVKGVRDLNLASDTIQNIFRCAARNYTNREPVTVYLFYDANYMQGVTTYLQCKLQSFGAKFEFVELEELERNKIMRRESKNGHTNPQIVFAWLKSIPNDRRFTLFDIAKDTGLTNKEVAKVKERNTSIANLLIEVGKRGRYKLYMKKVS